MDASPHGFKSHSVQISLVTLPSLCNRRSSSKLRASFWCHSVPYRYLRDGKPFMFAAQRTWAFCRTTFSCKSSKALSPRSACWDGFRLHRRGHGNKTPFSLPDIEHDLFAVSLVHAKCAKVLGRRGSDAILLTLMCERSKTVRNERQNDNSRIRTCAGNA